MDLLVRGAALHPTIDILLLPSFLYSFLDSFSDSFSDSLSDTFLHSF